MRNLKNKKSACKDEDSGKMKKRGRDMVLDRIWKLCIMTFESGVLSEVWRSAVIVPLYKGKEEESI